MNDTLMLTLLALGVILGGAGVVWTFSAEDRAAMRRQPAKLAAVQAELDQLRARRKNR